MLYPRDLDRKGVTLNRVLARWSATGENRVLE